MPFATVRPTRGKERKIGAWVVDDHRNGCRFHYNTAAGDLAKVQGETQGLLFRIKEGPPRPGLLADAEALAARQRKAWARLDRQARQAAK
jgi:hypothetical protein